MSICLYIWRYGGRHGIAAHHAIYAAAMYVEPISSVCVNIIRCIYIINATFIYMHDAICMCMYVINCM